MIVCTSMEKDFQIRFSDGTHEAFSDTSPAHGGASAGFSPHELLCAALGNCIAITTRIYAKMHDIPLKGVTVTVSLKDDDPAKSVFEYSMEYTGNIDEKTREKLVRVAGACPVHKALQKEMVFKHI